MIFIWLLIGSTIAPSFLIRFSTKRIFYAVYSIAFGISITIICLSVRNKFENNVFVFLIPINFFINSFLVWVNYVLGQRRIRVDKSSELISQAYSAMHNGPLQKLAVLIYEYRQNEDLFEKLEDLNAEIRSIYEFFGSYILEKSGKIDDSLIIVNNLRISLKDNPLHEVLYAVYNETIHRDFPGFGSIKINVVNFESLDEKFLTIEEKKRVVRFLEEALVNVGKHTIDARRLMVVCKNVNGFNKIRIEDDGNSRNFDKDKYMKKNGRGTLQFQDLAAKLKGEFSRSSGQNGKGCVVELIWAPRKYRSFLRTF